MAAIRHIGCAILLLAVCVLLSVTASAADTHMPPASDRIDMVYAINYADHTCHPVSYQAWEEVRAALSLPLSGDKADASQENEKGFLFQLKDGTRQTYILTKNQLVTKDMPLTLSLNQRKSLEQLLETLCGQTPAKPSALIFMEPSEIQKVTLKGQGITDGRLDPEKSMDFSLTAQTAPATVKTIAEGLRDLMVVRSGDTKSFTGSMPPETAGAGAVTVSLDAAGGVHYDISLTDTVIAVQSSKGVRGYYYTMNGGSDTGASAFRKRVWNSFTSNAAYDACTIFRTKTNGQERLSGTFFDSANAPGDLAKLSLIIDRVFTGETVPATEVSGTAYLEIYARERSSGRVRRFELDNANVAYYEDASGRGKYVRLGPEDWKAINALAGSVEKAADDWVLLERDGRYALAKLTAEERSSLYQSKPKDPAYKPYNTGQRPDYALEGGIHCWRSTQGRLTETTVYPKVMVQESNVLPWTPALFDAADLYLALSRRLY